MDFFNTAVLGSLSLYDAMACFVLYSFLGWCCEVVYVTALSGKPVNRGFLNGPVCPIYGFGVVAVLWLLDPIQDKLLLLFLAGGAVASTVELVGGWALYKLYHTRWWDYTARPFNIGGYICLQYSLLWGLGVVIVVKLIHPPIARLVALTRQPAALAVLVVCYLLYAADTVATAVAAAGLAKDLDALETVADSLHAVSDHMSQALGSTALEADQKMDESRLQLKLAAAEARQAADGIPTREQLAALLRDRAENARQNARHAAESLRLNAAEAATAARLAAHGGAERAAEALQLEQLAEELLTRSLALQARFQPQPRLLSQQKRRLMRAFPEMQHGDRKRTLDSLRDALGLDRKEDGTPKAK